MAYCTARKKQSVVACATVLPCIFIRKPSFFAVHVMFLIEDWTTHCGKGRVLTISWFMRHSISFMGYNWSSGNWKTWTRKGEYEPWIMAWRRERRRNWLFHQPIILFSQPRHDLRSNFGATILVPGHAYICVDHKHLHTYRYSWDFGSLSYY